MFNLFNRKKGKAGKDSHISSKELTGEETAGSEASVQTAISYHPDVEIGSEEKYYFQFLNNELEPLKPNQISLAGIELRADEDKVEVTAFVRNSLAKGIKLQETPLLLLGPDGIKLARRTFDLSQIGEIPAESSRPWAFVFAKEDLFATEFPQTGWTLAFELKKPHALDLDESWEKSLQAAGQEKLQQLIRDIEPPKPGEVNFMGLQAVKQEDGNLHITMLIRNGSDKNITLQQLPLIVEDASQEVIAKGGFKLDNLEVKSNTSKPWTFIFPAEMITKEDIDLSRWKAYPPQN
ncbi:accessory Sec system S-layer assembly protein [Bacillus ectoiniformans]|uniref:accessory Sec system S-layer assembly protein n=1 Tax=Bacillus ectoiniformans TaxID=1494429 RepID=UPI00195DD9B6|nr:accessory Sec system S-layer assembly protein [Bacillus ectoiniformans]MBM7648404.1 accessory Sec system S-layer assembly protein [Bacillus ectoiniformans]